MKISESIEISASPDAVWAVLSDLAGYASWNPFIVSASGPVVVGQQISARIQPPEGRGMSFRPRVTAADEASRLAWLGHLVVPGLFDGAHEFTLELTADGGTQFTQSETFTGLLVPLFKGTVGKAREGFRQMNDALALEVAARESRTA